MSSDGDNAHSLAGGNVIMSEDLHEANEGHSCTAVNANTGAMCGETEGLRILDQFRQIYEARMQKIEQDEATGTEIDFVPMKLNVMKEWIKDLGEQNVMLVRTVEDLEQAACYRVKILEEKLKETAGIVSEKMSRLTKPSEDTVNNLSTRIYQLEKEEETLQEKIEYLRSDIRGLLELIRRARCENCWCLKGIKFYEIRANEIPLPTVCSCTEVNPCPSINKELRLILELDDLARDRLLRSASSQIHDYVDRSACPICSERQTHDAADNESVKSLKRRLEVLSENEKKAHEYQAELEEKVSDLDNKLISREETIKKYISMLQSLRDNLKKRWAPKSQRLVEPSRQSGQDLEFDIASFVEMVECAIATRTGEEDRRENEKKHVEKPNSSDVVVEELRAKLQEKSLEIERLSRRLSFLEKESLETREALTNEVAEKHDMGMALRTEVATLEEQCRRANMLMQFKEDIIKGMRRELKQRVNTKATDTGSSGRKVRINADVVYCDQPAESSPRISMNRHGSHLVPDLNKAKASWKRENEALYYLRTELEEVLEELHAKEREDYERDIASAHVKLKDIGTLLDNYNTEVIDRNDTKRQERQSDSKITIQKLAKSIANLSNVCVESASGIVLLERALEDSDKDDKSANQETRVGHEFNERWKWDVFDRQFNAMEEFRVCTVEAQAATENLREEMEIVIGNLQTRHQQYVDLSSVVKEMQNVLAKTKENVTAVMCRLEQQEQEKICHNEKIASSEVKLKDMKNEINKARLERSRDVVDFSGRHRNTSPMTDPNAPTELIDKVVDTVAHVVCHLRLIRSQDQCGASLLGELRGQLCTLERNLDDVQNEMDRVLSENEIAQKVLNEKIERLDKFERELDYAHTKMQDTLESIVQSKQRMIDVGVCNLCSCTPNDGAMPGFETTPRNEDNRKNSSGDVDQLKNALRSKDKLLEDKDEIIRIQKDSITMTHVELKDLHQKMQAKIDAQNVAIAQHVEEKRLLLEQSKLQSQTIGHLREAVVEAKRSRTAKQQSHQKSALDLSVSECCDKDETIRMLSLFLRETQAQYNDCFTEAAEQDTRLEIQRQAIESLQKAIICRDLVYYSLLIKAQAFFRGRIGDVRLIRSKMDSLAKSKQYLEDKCRRIKRLWREADRELRKIKCITSWELNCEQGSRDCATCTDALERCSNAETEARVNNLLRENEDLKRQLKSRRLEFDLFDQEVRGQLYNNNRTEGLADGSAGLRDSEDCPHINCMSSNDELNRRNTELDKLIDEAKDKQEELAMFQDMREQFETSENLERLNECLKKELFILRRRAEGDYSGRERGLHDLQPMHSEARQSVECKGGECARERERDSMKGLRDQLSSTRELTDECMAELRVSREMLSFLRGRICSLKKLLKEKSDEMAKLQADHQMIKNDYSILKTENGIFADKARAEIGEFREKLKALQAELRLVDGNYRRVSEDFDKSQKLLIEAARREVELQHGVTAMEQIFYSKLTSAEREGRRMSDLVDMLRSDLENAREELSAREENFAEKCRNAYDQMGTLEDRVALLEDSKLLLTRQLQECRLENCKLVAENTRLMENGCRCVQELEDTRNVLLELRGECKTKAQTLNSISAELNHVAASRSELCDESQLVVACIRAWIEEQRRLVENLSKKLKNEKNRIACYAFEKKALVATVKELTRVNGTLSEFSMRRKICQGHSPNRRYAKSNGYQTSASYNGSQKPVLTTSSTTVCTRPLKRRCVCLTRTSRRTLLRGNSWWFPKLEHVSKELCRKNRRRGEKLGEEYRGDETSMDETRDFGYQSSASK